MAFQAGAIVSKMTLDRSKFSASIKAVRKQTKTLGGWVKKNSGQFKAMGLAATAAGAAVLLVFKKMVKQYVETGDMIHKMAIRTGFAAETLSELAYAADISGADITMLEKAVKKMAKTISDADRGMATYIDAFKAIGFEVEDLMGLHPEKQFMKIGLAIADIEDPTLRAAAAVDIFGRAGTMLLPLFAEGSEGIKTLSEDAHRLGIIFDEEAAAKAAALKDAQTALTGSVKGLSIAILNDLIPVLTTVTKSFTDFFVTSRVDANNWATAILKFFELIAKGSMKLLAGIQILQSAIFEMASYVTQAMRESIEKLIIGFGVLAKVGVPVKGLLTDLVQAWVDLTAVEKGYTEQMNIHINQAADVIVSFQSFFTMLEKIAGGLEDGKKGIKDIGTAAAETVPVFTSWATSVGLIFQAVLDNITTTGRGMSGILGKAVTEMSSHVFGYKKDWMEVFGKIYQAATQFTYALGGLFDQMSTNEMATIDNLYEKRKLSIEKSLMNEEEKAAAMESLDKEFETRRKEAMRAQAKRTKAMGIMESIIATAAAVAQALPNIPLAIAVGIMGAIQTALIAAQPLPALAKGGAIGAAGIVGEEGPELFMPATPGTIIPLRTEAAAMGAPMIKMTFLGPLISTTGVARADLERAGNTLWNIIEGQARRRGYSLNGT